MYIVEMFRIPVPEAGYDNFDCPGNHWDTLQALGKSYGWVPFGTEVDPRASAESVSKETEKLAELQATVPVPFEPTVNIPLFNDAGEEIGYQTIPYYYLNTYEPRSWCDPVRRMITPEDANAWALALEQVLKHLDQLGIDLPHEGPNVLSESVSLELNILMNGGLSRTYIKAFIA